MGSVDPCGAPPGEQYYPPLVTSGLRPYDDNGCSVLPPPLCAKNHVLFCALDTHNAKSCSEPRTRAPGVPRAWGESWKQLIPSTLQERHSCIPSPWCVAPLAFHKERCLTLLVGGPFVAPTMATFWTGTGSPRRCRTNC